MSNVRKSTVSKKTNKEVDKQSTKKGGAPTADGAGVQSDAVTK